MASQPLNTTISVKRVVRAYRQDFRHEAILSLTGGVLGGGSRDLVMSVPSQEELWDESRDGSTLVTTSVDEAKAGLPIVRFLGTVTTAAAAVAGMPEVAGFAKTSLDFPIRIGRDTFLTKSDANVTDDLHQDLRDV